MCFRGLISACVVFLLCCVSRAEPEIRRAIPASPVETRGNPNDVARFIAGIAPVPGSPLSSMAGTPEWNAYASYMNDHWKRFDYWRLQPIRSWRGMAMGGMDPSAVFYPFSGPDFVYVATFFPGASRFILCGLEPVGEPPSVEKLRSLPQALGWLQASFKTLLEAGYFVTKDMRVSMNASPLQGTIPILCVMLARSGDRIVSVDYDKGHAVIHYVRQGGQAATVEYYCVNLRNDGLGRGSGFAGLVKSARPGAAYIKSASYLMHESDFSAVRDLILSTCPVIVQDDSGIPLRDFDPQHWTLRIFGTYAHPLDIFKKYYQPDMAELYQRTPAGPLGFGAGYQWNPKTANLIIATRK